MAFLGLNMLKGLGMAGKIVRTNLLPLIFGIIDKASPDKGEAGALKERIQSLARDNQIADLIAIELRSESWLQRSWRPVLMLTITGLMINTYLIVPYVEIILKTPINLVLPAAFWDLLLIGVGGYIMGRSFEKSIREWRNPL